MGKSPMITREKMLEIKFQLFKYIVNVAEPVGTNNGLFSMEKTIDLFADVIEDISLLFEDNELAKSFYIDTANIIRNTKQDVRSLLQSPAMAIGSIPN